MIFLAQALELGNEEKIPTIKYMDSALPVIAKKANIPVNRYVLEWNEVICYDGARNISQPQSPLFF